MAATGPPPCSKPKRKRPAERSRIGRRAIRTIGPKRSVGPDPGKSETHLREQLLRGPALPRVFQLGHVLCRNHTIPGSTTSPSVEAGGRQPGRRGPFCRSFHPRFPRAAGQSGVTDGPLSERRRAGGRADIPEVTHPAIPGNKGLGFPSRNKKRDPSRRRDGSLGRFLPCTRNQGKPAASTCRPCASHTAA